jgi:hypothetical protein
MNAQAKCVEYYSASKRKEILTRVTLACEDIMLSEIKASYKKIDTT